MKRNDRFASEHIYDRHYHNKAIMF